MIFQEICNKKFMGVTNTKIVRTAQVEKSESGDSIVLAYYWRRTGAVFLGSTGKTLK